MVNTTFAIKPQIGTATQSTADDAYGNNITLYGTQEQTSAFDTMLTDLLPTDMDIKEALSSLGDGLNITFGQLGNDIDGQAKVGGNDMVLDVDLLKPENKDKLKDVFLHELTHIVGLSHADEDVKQEFNDAEAIFTNGTDDDYDFTKKPEEHQGQIENMSGMDHSGGAKEDTGKGGMEHGGSTPEAFLSEIDIIADAIGLDITGMMANAVTKGHAAADKDNNPDENVSTRKEDVIKMRTVIVSNYVKGAMEEILKKVDEKVKEIMNDGTLDENEQPFMNALATWIKTGFHSQHENGTHTGIHAWAKSGDAATAMAFQTGHMFNVGNDSWFGQEYREQGAAQNKLSDLDGTGLFNVIKEQGNDFLGMFKSTGKTSTGKESSLKQGELSIGWGASGDASDSVNNGFGHMQNFAGDKKLLSSYDKGNYDYDVYDGYKRST
jgi:hypothetical protein